MHAQSNPQCFTSDLGLWFGAAGGQRDDRLCGHALVQSPRGHPELDALRTDG